MKEKDIYISINIKDYEHFLVFLVFLVFIMDTLGYKTMEYKKIKSLITYIISECQDHLNGIPLSKLYKILYFIDFGNYALHAKSVSELDYLKFKFGPVPKGLHDYLELLENDKIVDRRQKIGKHGIYEVFEIYSEHRSEELPFNQKQKETIKRTIDFFKNQFANQASEETHYHSSWITTSNGEIIPYEKAAYCDFEWLGYFNDKSHEEYEEIKKDRNMFKSDQELNQLWSEIQDL